MVWQPKEPPTMMLARKGGGGRDATVDMEPGQEGRGGLEITVGGILGSPRRVDGSMGSRLADLVCGHVPGRILGRFEESRRGYAGSHCDMGGGSPAHA